MLCKKCFSYFIYFQECLALFPVCDSQLTKSDKFVMFAAPHTTHDHVKAVVTVLGDTITQAVSC